jgi:hypothetical protein
LAELVTIAAELHIVHLSIHSPRRHTGLRGSFAGSTYSRPKGPIALT